MFLFFLTIDKALEVEGCIFMTIEKALEIEGCEPVTDSAVAG